MLFELSLSLSVFLLSVCVLLWLILVSDVLKVFRCLFTCLLPFNWVRGTSAHDLEGVAFYYEVHVYIYYLMDAFMFLLFYFSYRSLIDS